MADTGVTSVGRDSILDKIIGKYGDIGSVLRRVKTSSRYDILNELMAHDEEAILSVRDIKFNSVVERYNKECDVLNMDGLGKPVLSLKSRRGDNAHASRVEDVVELYV